MDSECAQEQSKREGFKDGNELLVIECPETDDKPINCIVFGDEKLYLANKEFLCERCPVLEGVAEKGEDGWEVDLETTDYVVETILHYLYFSQLEILKGETDEHLINLLDMTDFLQLKEAEDAVFSELVSVHRNSNFVHFIRDLYLVKKHKKVRLERVADSLLKHLKYLCSSNLFNHLRPSVVKTILRRSLYTTVPVCRLTKALINWVKCDVERENLIPFIARYTKWAAFDPADLRNFLLAEPLLQKSVIEAARQRNCDLSLQISEPVNGDNSEQPIECKLPEKPAGSHEHQPKYLHFQNSKRGIFVMGSKNDQIIVYVATADGKWTRPVKVEIPLVVISYAAYVRGHVYMISDQTKCLSSNKTANESSPILETLVKTRTYSGSVVVGNYLYAIAGLDEIDQPTVEFERLLLNSDDMCLSAWENLEPLTHQRWVPGVAVGDKGSIFVIGGHTRKCECYDIKSGKWRMLSSLPRTFGNCGMVATFCDGRIYCLRDDAPGEICILNPETNQLEVIITSGELPKFVLSLFNFDSNVCIVGECGQFFILDDVAFIWTPMPKHKIPTKLSKIWSVEDIDLEELMHVYQLTLRAKSATLPASPIIPKLVASISEPSLRPLCTTTPNPTSQQTPRFHRSGRWPRSIDFPPPPLPPGCVDGLAFEGRPNHHDWTFDYVPI